ncbi:MAG: sensor histidine kinase [Planctomycetota bacterium]|jgi:signal transduction histidine kinase
MRRPWQTWLLFALCLAVVTAGMVWLTLMALDLNRRETDAKARAALEENVRLALWRMESALTGLVVQESIQPYFEYTPFYPVERAYTRMFNELERGEVLVPSRLLAAETPHILLHFQIEPDGNVTSPQVPEGNMRDLAEAAYTTVERIEEAAARLEKLRKLLDREALLDALPQGTSMPEARVEMNEQVQDFYNRNTQVAQAEMSKQEFQMRGRSFKNIAAQRPESQGKLAEKAQGMNARNEERLDNQEAGAYGRTPMQQSDAPARAQAVGLPADVRVGAFKSLWLYDAMILARRVAVNGGEYVQGAWLDWDSIRKWLLEEILDLFPAAELVPAGSEEQPDEARRLAALPVVLLPGVRIDDKVAGFTPIHMALVIAWGCLLLAGGAVVVLLSGALTLSERRGAFVSAVTHELRTPLTTLRMYTEMLSEGMVPDEEKRGKYLATMQAEADRLGHLVENVLAYSRLERHKPEGRMETLSVDALLGRVRDRLAGHAEQVSMALSVNASEADGGLAVRADTGAVEQILFNLVDNACKYAAAAKDRTIHLDFSQEGKRVLVKVRDHGPGVRQEETRRLFQPFRKSAHDAAKSAPGVGLGLALSRRLAREMGGDLFLDHTVREGACFVLALTGE